MFGMIDTYALLALPLFVLAGSLMSHGALSLHLVRFARPLVRHFQAGLCHVSIVSSMVFAGVSGSSTADASAIGSVVIPTMKGAGYKPGWSLTNLQSKRAKRSEKFSWTAHS
jgi:TRAP-type C4-dicarboxylate transport system permease large subunit